MPPAVFAVCRGSDPSFLTGELRSGLLTGLRCRALDMSNATKYGSPSSSFCAADIYTLNGSPFPVVLATPLLTAES